MKIFLKSTFYIFFLISVDLSHGMFNRGEMGGRCHPCLITNRLQFQFRILVKLRSIIAYSVSVCSGSANGMGRSLNSVGKEIQILRDLYQNCTLVTGNLEILGVTPQHLEEANITSLDFLANIEEVSYQSDLNKP